MPQAAATAVGNMVLASGAGGVAATAAYAATYVVTAAAISYGMSVISSELFGPEIPSFDENLSSKLDMRMDSNPPRRFIYGETRVSGPMPFAQASKRTITGDTLEMLHYEVIIASHEVDSYREIWLNEEKATLSSTSNEAWPDGSTAATDTLGNARYSPAGTVYSEMVMLKAHRGNQTQADPDATATSWIGVSEGRMSSDIGYDIAYVYVTAKHDGEVFQNGIPKISALVRGKNDVYDPRTETYGYTDNVALCLADWMITPRNRGGGGWDYDEIDEASLIAAANVCEDDLAVLDNGTTQKRYRIGGSFLSTASRGNTIKMFLDSMAGSIERVNGKWYIRAGKYTTPVVTLSEANWIEPLSMSFRTSLKDSTNAIRPILAGEFSEYQESDVEVVKGELVQDVTSNQVDNTFSQPAVKMENGYQVRFTIWGGSSFANWGLPGPQIVEEKYYWVINSTVSTFQISATRDGTPVDFTSFGPGTINCWWDKYLTEDQGRRRIVDRKYMLVNDPEQARRLAFIELKRMRSEVTVTARSDLSAFNAIVGDIMTVNDTERGFSSKIFEVMRWGFGVQNGALGCSLVLRAANDDDWDWDNGRVTATEPHESIAVQNLRDIPPPSDLTVESGTSHLYVQSDGTIITRAYLSWTGSGSALVSISGQYEIQFRKTVAAPDPETNPENPWQIADFVHGSITAYYLMQPQDGVDYDFRVRARTGLGFTTAWVEVLAHTVLGKTEPPNNVTLLSSEPSGSGVKLSWTNPAGLDVSKVYIDRKIDAGAYEQFAAVVVSELGAQQTFLDKPAVATSGLDETWTYRLRVVDSSGNISAAPHPETSILITASTTSVPVPVPTASPLAYDSGLNRLLVRWDASGTTAPQHEIRIYKVGDQSQSMRMVFDAGTGASEEIYFEPSWSGDTEVRGWGVDADGNYSGVADFGNIIITAIPQPVIGGVVGLGMSTVGTTSEPRLRVTMDNPGDNLWSWVQVWRQGFNDFRSAEIRPDALAANLSVDFTNLPPGDYVARAYHYRQAPLAYSAQAYESTLHTFGLATPNITAVDVTQRNEMRVTTDSPFFVWVQIRDDMQDIIYDGWIYPDRGPSILFENVLAGSYRIVAIAQSYSGLQSDTYWNAATYYTVTGSTSKRGNLRNNYASPAAPLSGGGGMFAGEADDGSVGLLIGNTTNYLKITDDGTTSELVFGPARLDDNELTFDNFSTQSFSLVSGLNTLAGAKSTWGAPATIDTGIEIGSYRKAGDDTVNTQQLGLLSNNGTITGKISLNAISLSPLHQVYLEVEKGTQKVRYSETGVDRVGGSTLLTFEGRADTALQLATARTISLTGDVSGSASFDGTANISLSTSIGTIVSTGTGLDNSGNSISCDFTEFATYSGNPDYVIAVHGTQEYKTAPDKLAVGKLVVDALPAASTWYPVLVNGTGTQSTYSGGTDLYMDNGVVHAYRFDATSTAGEYRVNGVKVVDSQQVGISNCNSAQAFAVVSTAAAFQETDDKVNAILTALRNHGLIAT